MNLLMKALKSAKMKCFMKIYGNKGNFKTG